jgi:drug/metabolite transporter (DMT)-like permease
VWLASAWFFQINFRLQVGELWRDASESFFVGQMFFGLIPLLLIGIPLEGNPLHYRWTPMAIVSLLYLAIVGSVIAFLLYYWLIHHMDVTKTMLISLVTPVVAVMLGMVVLDERLDWRTVAGGAMIMSGIALATRIF